MSKETVPTTATEYAETVWVDVKYLAGRFNVTPKTIWSWSRNGTSGFPAPTRLTPSCTRWRLADIESFETEITHYNAA